jgi:hypothetical protein
MARRSDGYIVREPTKTVMLPDLPPKVAEIVTEPVPAPVTRPLFTVAIAGSEVVQAAEFVTSVCVNGSGRSLIHALADNRTVAAYLNGRSRDCDYLDLRKRPL